MPQLRSVRLSCLVAALALAASPMLVIPSAHAAPDTATIEVADTSLKIGETSQVTVTFSEPATNVDSGDFTVENGSLSSLSTADSGNTWTATLTPDTDVEDVTNVITLDHAGVTDFTGTTPGSGTSTSNNYAVDTKRPTASIAVADTNLRAGETSTVTITFSEPVTGLTTGDFTVANGTLSGLSSSDAGTTWTATLTPSSNIEDTTNVITLDNTGVADAAGNTGSGTTDSNNYAIDTLRPSTVSIVVADTDLRAGETSAVTIAFSEKVTGLTKADLTVQNGSLSEPSTADGGTTWTATLTPGTGVEDATNVITLDNTGVVDAAGNTGSGTTDSNNYKVDTLRPTTTIVVGDTNLRAGDTSPVTITFSEPVTGLSTGDFTVQNGSLSGLSSSDGGTTWTATLTPGSHVEDSTNVITLDNTGVTDAAGNTGSGTTDSNNYRVDTVRPSASSIVVSDTALAAGETAKVTVTFSESVFGLAASDFTVQNGSLSEPSSSDGGVTWTTTLTPDAGVEDATNVITLAGSGVSDSAGNSGSGSRDSNNYAIDTLRPTASIVVDDTDLRAGETSPVTITFSEAVGGVTLADLTVAGGDLSDLASADGGVTWTATLTPAAATFEPTNRIELDNTGVHDTAGNSGAGVTRSNAYAVDTDVDAPASSSTGVGVTGNPTFEIDYTATDVGSGVASVELYVRKPGSDRFVKVATDAKHAGSFTYEARRDGSYAFYTVATDRAGLVEEAPSRPDHRTRLDREAPVVGSGTGDGGAVSFDPRTDRCLRVLFTASERVSYRTVIKHDGQVVRTYRPKTSERGLLLNLWCGRDQAGNKVAPGGYRFVARVTDAAGNRGRAVQRVRVTR